MRVLTVAGAAALIAAGVIATPARAQQPRGAQPAQPRGAQPAPAAAPAPAPAAADSMTTTPGAVMRVTLYRTNPGMGPENVHDFRNHVLPILEQEKAAGLILNYMVMTNVTTDSPEDWDYGTVVTYANWAALDSLGARADPITLRHYGSADARTAAGQRRAQLRTVVMSRLERAQNVGH